MTSPTVPDSQKPIISNLPRQTFLQKMFGSSLKGSEPYWQLGQNMLDLFFAMLMPSHPAGQWQGHELANGACFVVPLSSYPLPVHSMNGSEACLSPEACGLVVSLFAIGAVLEVLFVPDAEPGADQCRLDDLYYLLRDYGAALPEHDAIFTLID